MQQKKLIAITIILLLIGLTIITSYTIYNKAKKPTNNNNFYVGVTYCGSSIQEAKELVDKVKDYTNLFTLLAGTLQSAAAIEEIGDYVVASGLSFAVYNSRSDIISMSDSKLNMWANSAKERWGEQFIGLYYYDEPGGNMLDGSARLKDNYPSPTGEIAETMTVITKGSDGTIYFDEWPQVVDLGGHWVIRLAYYPDGRITFVKEYEEIYGQALNSLLENNSDLGQTYSISYRVTTEYFSNGTSTIEEHKTNSSNWEQVTNFYTGENITEYSSTIQSYEQVLKNNPIQNYDDATKAFVNMNKQRMERINKEQLNKEEILVFTADYGLYWWDYQGGYDVVLAELAWNHSVPQQIGLVRGAANVQGKSWGTCITWKYTHPPYLTDGEEMFEQMKTSYEAGAEYVLIFNYSEDPANPNTLQEEHFQVLERFWEDVVQNSKVKHGCVKADAVLVLPQNYGWGMRHPDDHIWGIWRPDDTTQQIWTQLQNKLDKHGLKLDIVFEDPNYQVTGKYNNIYYWNQK